MSKEYFNTPSPAFSSFREIMDKWDNYCVIEEQEKKINDIMDRHGMILFFKKGESLFGSPEDSRLIFSKLKSDDEDEVPGFRDEARFLGVDLLKAMFGSPDDSVENLFSNKDLPEINPCDREEIIKLIMNHKPKKEKKK